MNTIQSRIYLLFSVFVLLVAIYLTECREISTSPSTTSFHGNNTTTNSTMGRKCNFKRTFMQTIFFICLLVFIPITIFGNGLVCIVVINTLSIRRQQAYIFLISLAVADIFVGAITMPIKAKIQWDGGCFLLPRFVCWIYVLEEIAFSVSSTFHLFAIAVDRYLSLRYTFRYKKIVTQKVLIVAILCIWTFAVIWSILSIFEWEHPSRISIRRGITGCIVINRTYYTTIFLAGYIIPVFCMAFIYYFIYATAIHHINEISKLEILDSLAIKEKRRRKKHFRTLRSIVIVFTAYTLCWIPCVIFILIMFFEKSVLRHNKQMWFRALYFIFIDFLPHLNSALNPFIYVISNKEFRSGVMHLYKKVQGIKIRYSMRKPSFYSTQTRFSIASLGLKSKGEITLKDLSRRSRFAPKKGTANTEETKQ